MKILHVTKKYPNALGGDSTIVSGLQKLQELDGHKTAILTSNCDEIKNAKNIYKFGLKTSTESIDGLGIKRLISLPFLFIKAFSVIRKEKPDVIHTHSIDMAFFISFAARHYKVPILHTFHILTFYDKTQSVLKRKKELFFLKHTRPYLVTTPNPKDKEILLKAGVTQTRAISYGIDLSYWEKQERLKEKNVFTFVSVGRLEDHKGFEYLVKAAAILKDDPSVKKFKIVIVGEGSLLTTLKKLIVSLDLSEYVSLVGRKTRTQLRDIYSASDSVAIASLYETGPLTLLEAWSMKLPVISTPVGILSEKNSALGAVIVKKRNKKSLADGMKEIMEKEKTRNDVIKIGSSNVINYSEERFSRKLMELYEQMLLPCIVHVSAFYPPHIGGVELRVKELSERLAANGYEIDVLTSSIGSKRRTITRKNLKVTYLPSIEVAHTPIMPTLLWRLVRIDKTKSIIHVYVAQVFLPEIVALIAKLRKIPYIADFEMDTERSGKMGVFLPIHKKLILGPVLRNAAKVIVLSDDYINIAVNKYGVSKNNISVISSGTSFEIKYKHNFKQRFPVRILFVGRFADQKNPILLLQAMSLIAKTSANVELVMVGDGELRPEIESYIADNNLGSRVKLLGFLTGEKLEKQYEQSDIFVLPSRAESFGIVLIEAMSKGLPIVATDITAVRNTVKNRQNGLLVSQDPESIVEAIQELVNNKKLYETVSSNNSSRAKGYHWDRIVNEIELAYEN
jgi:glycosyltransferase involved in cell wall biosynthesis